MDGEAKRAASLSVMLAVVSPATQILCFFFGQELLGQLVPLLVGKVDRSVDLSQERHHSEFYDPLELRVQCAALLSALLLIPVFFTAAAAANQEVARSHMVKRALISWFWGTVTAHITTILFGAPFVTAFWKTLSLSMLLGGVSVMPLGCTLGNNIKVWQRVISHNDLRNAAEIQFYVPAAFAAVGTWIGAFPIPLDWDKPWQAWPITCTGGAAAGHALGLIGVAGYFVLQAQARGDKQKANIAGEKYDKNLRAGKQGGSRGRSKSPRRRMDLQSQSDKKLD